MSVWLQVQQQLIDFGLTAGEIAKTIDAVQENVRAMGGSDSDPGELAFVLTEIITGRDIERGDRSDQ